MSKNVEAKDRAVTSEIEMSAVDAFEEEKVSEAGVKENKISLRQASPPPDKDSDSAGSEAECEKFAYEYRLKYESAIQGEGLP